MGGAGSNAVNHMYNTGIKDVVLMVCNTDRQALDKSPVPTKILIGDGLGAGNDPKKANKAAIEDLSEVSAHFVENQTEMLFITAGMGGGTGTGAAPVIAHAARSMGILTVGIVTIPSELEGPKRIRQAKEGLEELNKYVDALIVINNNNIKKVYGDLGMEEALNKANDVLTTAAKGISEMITRHGIINADFADVTSVLKDSHIALMGSARAKGEDKIREVTAKALSSPLLHHQDIKGARNILFNLSYGSNVKLSLNEAYDVLHHIQAKASEGKGKLIADIIWSAGVNETLNDEIELTLIATGFDQTRELVNELPDDILETEDNTKEEVSSPDTGSTKSKRQGIVNKTTELINRLFDTGEYDDNFDVPVR